MNDEKLSVTTTSGETFTAEDHKQLAQLVYRRFGHNLAAAASAWRRLLQNNCYDSQFATLVIPSASAPILKQPEKTGYYWHARCPRCDRSFNAPNGEKLCHDCR